MSKEYDAAVERGRVTWHCSDEGRGPDVGLSLGLGGSLIWAGEISKAAWSESEEDVAALGDDSGWWLLIYEPESRVLGKFVDAEAARYFIDRMAAVILSSGS